MKQKKKNTTKKKESRLSQENQSSKLSVDELDSVVGGLTPFTSDSRYWSEGFSFW
ncbi:MAG: hypothetical protein QNJ51_19685 [Calothrix sp. MO_167.B12]|nr:hypothetical protein [Calothrix sp. MO_167.B12]